MEQHRITINTRRYPGGLRIFECVACSYALAAEVNEAGMIRLETAVFLDHGDTTTSHALFQVHTEPPTLEFSAALD
ncbi:MAG: hypothetical protein KDE56_26245 [Anaerolineales bacterium]|nr:hypothetical protein [Anaerolineales bacterium]